MGEHGTDGIRGVALPTLLCSLVCGACVFAMALAAVLALQGPRVRPLPAPAVLSPARVLAVPPAAAPPVTQAPIAPTFVVELPAR